MHDTTPGPIPLAAARLQNRLLQTAMRVLFYLLGTASASLLTTNTLAREAVETPIQNPDLTGIYAASRLGSRASFGADLGLIEHIDSLGEEAWLEEQFASPPTYHDPIVAQLLARQAAGDFETLRLGINPNNFSALYGPMAWWHNTITAEDQLRQRVAYALSQIFVISDQVNALLLAPYGTSNYYDMLLSNAFGNFRDLLLDVSLHPAMGVFLSHLNNAAANPESGTFPDENYAREVMQLFSIGLFELNPDGSEITDTDGQPIASYNNQTIGEFARVFTGLSWGGSNRRFGTRRYNYQQPMAMFDAFHDSGEKTLLRGEILPAGQSGMQDIEAAIDNLFLHPNVGPFFGKQLIQRLVSSNPSPDYVARVASVFADNGQGVRGDMRAIIRAVLLDPEARSAPNAESNAGKLREPVLRYTSMLRKLGVTPPDGFYASTGRFVEARAQQHPLSAPSVFNFYLPSHQPVGALAEFNLVAPEFQITNSNSIIEVANLMQAASLADIVNDLSFPPFSKAVLTLHDYREVASDADALLDRLDLVFTYGTLSSASREVIRATLSSISNEETRIRVAAYLLLISPDFAVEN